MFADDSAPARIESRQLSIFARDARTVCAELELSWEDAGKLFADRLLSFDPAKAGALDESREAELHFLGALARTGCSRAMLRRLLRDLRAPYCYDLRRLYFDWSTQKWRLLPGEDDPEEAFFSLLGRLRERRAVPVLVSIRGWLDEALDLERDRRQVFAHPEVEGRSLPIWGDDAAG